MKKQINDSRRDTVAERSVQVAWIHCNYDPTRMSRCLQLAEEFLRAVGLYQSSIRIAVNNCPDAPPATSQTNKWNFVLGSNRLREFSAWEEGWKTLQEIAGTPDLIILTNDTFPFHQPYRHLLSRLLGFQLKRLLRPSSKPGWALGLVERGFAYEGLPEYLTSFFLILDRKAAEVAMPLITQPLPQWRICADVSQGKVVHSADKRYEDGINGWLLNPLERAWYGAQRLTNDNATQMVAKATCIVLEHSLSKRLSNQSIRLVSCFDVPAGAVARWLYRLDERLNRHRRFGKRITAAIP